MNEQKQYIFNTIMECSEYSNDEKINLMIAYEEENETNNTQYEINANRLYLQSIRDLMTNYRKDIQYIKSDIKNKDYKKAYEHVVTTQKKLDELEKVINAVPSSLTDTTIATLANIVFKGLSIYTIKVCTDKLLKTEKEKSAKYINKTLDSFDVDKSSKDMCKKLVGDTLTNRPSLKKDMKDSVTDTLIPIAIKTVVRSKNINVFKSTSLKLIKKTRKKLKLLERKIKFVSTL